MGGVEKCAPEVWFARDSPLEEGGFELSVPGGGTDSLNPDDAPGFCPASAPEDRGFELSVPRSKAEAEAVPGALPLRVSVA